MPAATVLTAHQVRIDGRPVPFQMAGAGDPIVLVHGLSGSGRWWYKNVPFLAQSRRVYLVDLPKFGRLRRHGRRFDLGEAGRWLAAWIDAAGLDQPDLVGHSMGGLIAVQLAAASPRSLGRLVLTAPAVHLPVRSLVGSIPALLTAAGATSAAFLAVLAYDAVRAGPATLWRASRQLLRENVGTEQLASITNPTLIVIGDRDPLVPVPVGQSLQQTIPGSRLVVVKGAGHAVMYDRPRAFNEAVQDFLTTSDTPTTGEPA
jgi:pimeloyl-ACP methyl ester carboxylesterase